MKRFPTRRAAKPSLFAAALLALLAPRADAQLRSDRSCDLCHGELEFLRRQVPTLEDARRLLVPSAAVRASAHDTLGCASCHGGFARFPHPESGRRTAGCASCHEEEVAPWRAGAHGTPGENGEGASCAACHGVHDVFRAGEARGRDARERLNAACLSCHPTGALPPRDPHADTLSCASCHEPHRTGTLEDPGAELAPLAQPRTCGACHEDAGRVATADAHGEALLALEHPSGLAGLALLDAPPPACTSCHGGHGMRAPSQEGFDRVMVGECGACHERAAESYVGTYHGKATTLGSEVAATCDHCHGSHRIFPASDARSAVAPQNLVETCRACHEQSREAFVRYDSHPDPMDRGRNAPLFYSFVFMNVMLFGVLGVFALHTALWWVRLILDRRKDALHAAEGSRG